MEFHLSLNDIYWFDFISIIFLIKKIVTYKPKSNHFGKINSEFFSSITKSINNLDVLFIPGYASSFRLKKSILAIAITFGQHHSQIERTEWTFDDFEVELKIQFWCIFEINYQFIYTSRKLTNFFFNSNELIL